MPRSTRRVSSGTVAPTNSGGSGRPRVDANDLCAGCIVWLPSRVDSDGSIKCNKQNCCNGELETGGYEHPVVVLSFRQKEGSYVRGDLVCTVACVTTFSDTSLSSYIKKRPRMRHMLLSIPIHDPAADTLDTAEYNIEQLHLEKDDLHKQSYVRLQHTYEVPSSMLCRYNFRTRQAYKLRLTEHSYKTLMGKLNATPEPYIETALVPITSESRLVGLAFSAGRAGRTPTRLPPSIASTRPVYVPPPSTPYQHTYPRYYGTVSPSPPTPRYPVPSNTAPPYDSYQHNTESTSPVVMVIIGCIIVGALFWYGSRT
jgi:hypothetical protein